MNEKIAYSEFFEFTAFKKRIWDSIFLVLFILVSLTCNYQEILFKRPQSVHIWRQTDCTSLALNYHQNDLPLLHPQMHFRFNPNAEAMGEFPVMYYLVGKLYDIFGFHEFIYRLFWLIIMFIGSFSLYRLSFEILDMPMESIFIGFLLMLSPVVSYYGVSFISDPVALFILPPAFWLLFKFWKGGSFILFFFSILLFTLSSLLKLSNIIIPFALLGILILYLSTKKNWKKAGLLLSGAIVITVLNYVWYSYSIAFNEKNDTAYFLMRSMPLWEMSKDEFSFVNSVIKNDRLPQLYNSSMIYITGSILLLTLIKRQVRFWTKTFIVSCLIGLLAFVVLFYQQFKYHDYYMIFMVMIFPVVFVSFYQFLKGAQMKAKWALLLKVIPILLLAYNTYHSSRLLKYRFNEPENPFYNDLGYFSLEPALEEMGVSREDYVISIYDPSPNATLYLMNRSGWSNLYHNPFKASDVELFKKFGARFLIVGGKDKLTNEELKPYMTRLKGRHKQIYVFEL